MHAATQNLRGGVSPRSTHLRGQPIIEYVLIIAVIGLVIAFAGPGVAEATRNQFNLVGNTVNSGTTGGVEGGGAYGGGSAGADSATVLQMLWFGVLPCHHAINAHSSRSAASNRKLHGREG